MLLATFIFAAFSVSAEQCQDLRPVPPMESLPACNEQTTCISKYRIDVLQQDGFFPRFADSLEDLRHKVNCYRTSAFQNPYQLNTRIKEYAFAPETEMALDIVDKIKAQVKDSLAKSRARMKFTAECASDLVKYETFNPDGTFDAESTTRKYSADNPDPKPTCAGLWDKKYARTPVLSVVAEELQKARIYLSLYDDWYGKDRTSPLQIPRPLWKGKYFEGTAGQIAPLNKVEMSKLDGVRRNLIRECNTQGKNSCGSSDELQAYALKRYWQQAGENPIVLYFKNSVDPAKPITGAQLQAAYNRHSEKLSELGTDELADQDYLKFNFALNDVLAKYPDDQRGDHCAVAEAMLKNFDSKDGFDNIIFYLSLVQGAYGALRATAGKTLASIVPGAFAGAKAFSYLGNVHMLNQMLTHHEIASKLESMCSQTHLRMPELCNMQTLVANENENLQSGTGLATTMLLSGFGLYGPAKALWVGKKLPSLTKNHRVLEMNSDEYVKALKKVLKDNLHPPRSHRLPTPPSSVPAN